MKIYFRFGLRSKSFIAVTLLLGLGNVLRAQVNIADISGKVLVTPPNASAFTQYGKVGVSQFTGIPDINIPLLDIKVDNLTIPVKLSYYAHGIQPNTHAGWVGTGWSLFTGGAITRKINGVADELIAAYPFQSSFLGFSYNIQTGDHLGWYWNHNALNKSDWASESAILGYAGIISIDGTNALVNDVSADEFDFSINGISGAFFLGEDGLWKVRTSNGENIKIGEPVIATDFSFITWPGNSPRSTVVYSTFYSFTLTTGDGIQYVFGDDVNAIDFNRSGVNSAHDVSTVAMAWHLKKIIFPSGKTVIYNYFRDGNQYVYTPSSHAGYYNVTAGYEPVSGLFPLGNNYASGSSADMNMADVNINITDPVYLSSIVFPEGKLNFHSAPSGESDALDDAYSSLNVIVTPNDATPAGAKLAHSILGRYLELIPAGGTANTPLIPSNWYRLNDIELDDYQGNKIKDIKLGYSQDINTRQFLSAVQTFGFFHDAQGTALPPYSFNYNATVLPKYCTRQVDHWGFYNGPSSVNPFPTVTVDGNNFPDANFQNAYDNFRNPNPSYVQAGLLTGIKYPTGGSTSFEYEPNKYVKWVGGLPITVNSLSQEAMGGGVRIKKIISKPSLSSGELTYEYSYVNDIDSVTTSGVLGMPLPKYFYTEPSLKLYSSPGYSAVVYEGLTYSTFSSTSIFPSQNDDGNVVTYSRVIERQSANGIYNGLKSTTFSNHDNGFSNEIPDGFYWFGSNDELLGHYSDRSLERGLTLNELYLNQQGDTVKLIQNTYNDDPDRFNQFTKSVIPDQTIVPVGSPEIHLVRISAVRNYCFYPFLKQKKEITYPSDYSAKRRTSISYYSYDASNGTRDLIKEVAIDSKGEQRIENHKYALDYSGTTATDAFSNGIKKLISLNASGLPVETYSQHADGDGNNIKTTSALLNSYSSVFPIPNQVYKAEIGNPTAGFVSSTTNSSGLVKDPTYTPRLSVDNFDENGNILQQHLNNNVLEAFQWGYDNNYPVVHILNAENTYYTYYTDLPITGFSHFLFAPLDYNNQSQAFTTYSAGAISLNIYWGSNPGPNSTANASYVLSGPVFESGQICTQGCNVSNPLTFSNMPAGNYNLTVIPNINNSDANMYVNYSYPSVDHHLNSAGTKEFFYEGFEENNDAQVQSENPHTGAKCLVGNYTVPFTVPNGKNYIIQWYSYNGKWQFNQQYYTSAGLTLSGTIDDVRIFPENAQMTSFTYDPLVGLTSEMDFNGKTFYYDYDPLARLKNIRDDQGNIIKNYQYNYANSCGPACSVLPMQTFNATNTLSYPVGVFNVSGKLLGNAANQSQYISTWMTDTANAHTGTIAAGDDSMHFKLTVNPGRIVPPSLTGCRYYQYDLAYDQLDAVRNLNGCYVDFGDGTEMRLGKTLGDTIIAIEPHTTVNYTYSNFYQSPEVYWIHTYPDSSQKTITIYHNDGTEQITLDNYFAPAPSLNRIKNLRGNIPQNIWLLATSCFQQASALTLSSVLNWNSINSVTHYQVWMGDGTSAALHMSYAQDFMANNKNLQKIITSNGLYGEGYEDTTFKISRLKTDWNTYFSNLQIISICDDHWGRENLSGLRQLKEFDIYAGNQNHSIYSAGNPLVPIPQSVIDNILIQIAAGAGTNILNGKIIIGSGGTVRSPASDSAVSLLKSKGWTILINNVQL